MADSYSGAAFAADAISRALSDMFKGMSSGLTSGQEVAAREQAAGQAARGEMAELSMYPVRRDTMEQQLAAMRQQLEHRNRMALLEAEGAELGNTAQRLENTLHDLRRTGLQENINATRAGIDATRAQTGLIPYQRDLMKHQLEAGQESLSQSKQAWHYQLKLHTLQPQALEAEINARRMNIRIAEEELKHAQARYPFISPQLKLTIDAAKKELEIKEWLFQKAQTDNKRLSEAVVKLQVAGDDPKALTKVVTEYGDVLGAHHAAVQLLTKNDTSAGKLLSILGQIETQADRESQQLNLALFGEHARNMGNVDGPTLDGMQWTQSYMRGVLARRRGLMDGITIPPVPPIIREKLKQYSSVATGRQVPGRLWGKNPEIIEIPGIVDEIEAKLVQGYDWTTAIAQAQQAALSRYLGVGVPEEKTPPKPELSPFQEDNEVPSAPPPSNKFKSGSDPAGLFK